MKKKEIKVTKKEVETMKHVINLIWDLYKVEQRPHPKLIEVGDRVVSASYYAVNKKTIPVLEMAIMYGYINYKPVPGHFAVTLTHKGRVFAKSFER